jgi:hypothetical protein
MRKAEAIHNEKDQRGEDLRQYREDRQRPYRTRRIIEGRIGDNTEWRSRMLKYIGV